MTIDTIPELIAEIAALPSAERRTATARLDAALDRPAPEARAALGLLALDITAGRVADAADVVVLPQLVPGRLSA